MKSTFVFLVTVACLHSVFAQPIAVDLYRRSIDYRHQFRATPDSTPRTSNEIVHSVHLIGADRNVHHIIPFRAPARMIYHDDNVTRYRVNAENPYVVHIYHAAEPDGTYNYNIFALNESDGQHLQLNYFGS